MTLPRSSHRVASRRRWPRLISPVLHLRDTLAAGDGLCDEAAVRILVEEGPERVRELDRAGIRFDKRKGS